MGLLCFVHGNIIYVLWCKCIHCFQGNAYCHARCRALYFLAYHQNVDYANTYRAGTIVNFKRSEVCHKGSIPLPNLLLSPPPKSCCQALYQRSDKVAAKPQPSLQQVSPFQWPLLSMLSSSRPSVPARQSGPFCNRPQHPLNNVFPGGFVHAMPVLCMSLCVPPLLEIPWEAAQEPSLVAILTMFLPPPPMAPRPGGGGSLGP